MKNATKTARKPLATHYSPYASHNRLFRNLKSWDDAWALFTEQDGWAERWVAEYRKSRGYRGHHANSRTAKCQRAFERGLRIRMRELDREATGDTQFCDTLFAS